MVEPHTSALTEAFAETGAKFVDLDEALNDCDILIVLARYELFHSVPVAKQVDKMEYATRGVWTK